MPNPNSLDIDTTFVELSSEPLSLQQIAALKDHYRNLRTMSKRYMRHVALGLSVLGLLSVLVMSEETYQSMVWIDWVLMVTVLAGIGFLVWGLLDDRLLDQHWVSVRVDGVEYGRLIHESMRERTSLLDSGRVDDIDVPKKSIYTHRFIHVVMEKERRHFIGLDRLIILNRAVQS